MIETFITAGKFDPVIKFSVAKFTRYTRNIDSSAVEWFFNLEGKITLTEISASKPLAHRHNFAMHLFRENDGIDMANWDKFRILEFEDEENKCFFTGSLLLKHDMTELGRMLDQAVVTEGILELTFLLDKTLKLDETSSYLDILALQSLALTNTLPGKG